MKQRQILYQENSVKLRLCLALALSFGVLILELLGGFEFSSSALVADALHIFTDIFAISFSLAALIISEKPPTSTLTYGYHRIEVFASLANGGALFIVTGFIAFGAYIKVLSPAEPYVPGTILIAIAALAINMTSHTILNKNPNPARSKIPYIVGEDLNIKSASTHLLGDALSSVAVILGAVTVYFTHNPIFDPAVAVLIGLLVLRSAIITTKAGLGIMLEGSPVKNMPALENDLEKVEGISDIHDLHVWRICSHITIATLHACLNEEGKAKRSETMNTIEGKLTQSYGIQHATIQLEDVCCVPKHSHSL